METTQRKTIRLPKWDISGAERVAIWRHARALISKRKGLLIKEYRRMRREWK